ncbi:hypothetical protein DFS34DRAFT_110779 [Phlyctochytrium arcticum]|nr:hypothetical protein DFS34DRAFT_110779 [Phlyctochytrium arcticum]
MPLVILTTNSIERSSKTMAVCKPPSHLGLALEIKAVCNTRPANAIPPLILITSITPKRPCQDAICFPTLRPCQDVIWHWDSAYGLENLPRDFNSRPSITYQLPCQDAMCFPTLMITKLGFGTRPTASRICPNIPSRGTRGGSNGVRTGHVGHVVRTDSILMHRTIAMLTQIPTSYRTTSSRFHTFKTFVDFCTQETTDGLNHS